MTKKVRLVISSPFLYAISLLFLIFFVLFVERKSNSKIFKLIPSVVVIYISTMALASFGFFEQNSEIDFLYENSKKYLLPAMLFLMLLHVSFSDFFKLGKTLLSAYVLALFSLVVAFGTVTILFGFDAEIASAFGALSGSWMGGMANMVAVASALNVSQEAFGYALIVDSVNYTIWVAFLLFLTPFAHVFNSFTASHEKIVELHKFKEVTRHGKKKYLFFIFFSMIVSFCADFIARNGFEILNHTTSTVIIATIFGIIGSFTKLKEMNGSNEVSSIMLYLLIALIGSKAIFENFNGVGIYVFAGFCVLIIHAVIMTIGAKMFKLDLFSIAIASLANIGGVASASLLAASYNKALVGVGVLMAIMGYIIGTFGGILVGYMLIWLSTNPLF